MEAKDQAIFEREEKLYNDNLVTDLIKQVEKEVIRHWEEASIAGADEFRQLEEIHRRVVNEPRTATGRQPPRPPPQWIWKKAKIELYGTAGGVDWIRYLGKLYMQDYIFFSISYKKPQERLIEDNPPVHTGAKNHDLRWSEEMEPLGIFRCHWLSHSPDINEIEPVWDDFKDSIEVEEPFTGANEETAERVKRTLARSWNGLSEEGIRNRSEDFRSRGCLVSKSHDSL